MRMAGVVAGRRLAMVLTALCVVPTCGALPIAATKAPPASSALTPMMRSDLYVVRRGWHIDIGFATANLKAPLSSLVTYFPGARYLVFGFGDRRYLVTSHRNAPILLAALWPGRAMVLTTGLVATPAQAFGGEHVVRLRVSQARADSAQQFIWRALDKSESLADPAAPPENKVEAYAIGPYEGSLFFAARARYSALHTCNTWAAEVLEAADLPIRPSGTIFAWQVWNRVEKLQEPESVSPAYSRVVEPGARGTP